MPKHKPFFSSNRHKAQVAIGIVCIALIAGTFAYYVQTGHAQPDLPTVELEARNDGIYVKADLSITWPDGTRNTTQTRYFCQPVLSGHFTVTCTYQGVTSADSPYSFDLSATHMEEHHTFEFGSVPPPVGNGDHILTFERKNGNSADFYLQPTEITSVAFGCGGVMVKSSGVWQQLMWASPPVSSDITQYNGIGVFYETGVVFLYGDSSRQMLVQADRRPFILFHMIRGSLTIPTVDGLTASGSRTLAAGQTVVFYAVNQPSAGAYLTSDVEQNPGLHVTFVTPEGVNVGFGLGYGSGAAKVSTQYNQGGDVVILFCTVQYPDGTYRMPSIPIVTSGWWSRKGLIVPNPFNFLGLGFGYCQAYRPDPATGTAQGSGYVTDVNYVNSEGFWGWSLGLVAYTAAPTHDDVYVAYYTLLLRQTGNDWETRKYLYVHIINSQYAENMDKGGSTTGMGLMTTSGIYTNETSQGGAYTSDFSVDPNYYAYNGQWELKTFNVGYTWEYSYAGTRITIHAPYGPVHVFTKFLYTMTGATLRIARYYWHIWLNHYLSSWASDSGPTPIPEGACMGAEERFGTGDDYDASIGSPTVQPSSFYLGFFPA